MAMIRTSGVGIEFYDRVMDRMAARSRRPHGVAVHFAGLCDGEINVVTVYRDATSRTATFADFSGPEIANAQVEGPERADIGRVEYEVERLLVSDDLSQSTERPVGRDLFAYTHFDAEMTADVYLKAVEHSSFPETWPSGLLLHMLCRHGRELVVIDIWDSHRAAGDHYTGTIRPSVEAVLGHPLPDRLTGDDVIKLHSLTVALEPDDPLRSFSKLSG